LDWRVELTPSASRELRKLNRQVARRIGSHLQNLVASCHERRQRDKGLTSTQVGLWDYRVVVYRVISQLKEVLGDGGANRSTQTSLPMMNAW